MGKNNKKTKKHKKSKRKIPNHKKSRTHRMPRTVRPPMDANIEFKKIENGDMIKLQCSPKVNQKEFSCYEDDTLYKLRDLWNARHSDRQIITNDTREIWFMLKENMKGLCNKESCWLKQKFVDGKLNKELKTSFAPEAPKEWKKKPNDWLSSLEILDVMKQYEKAYKCFEFIGPSSIDFKYKYNANKCVCNKLCNFNLNEKIKNKITKIGIIFNLDPHYKSGSHWVSLFINITKKIIFYFDSGGDKIPNEIMELVNTIIKQGNNLKPPIYFTFDQNYPNEHQYKNTECGVYSLYFIVNMLKETKSSNFFKIKKIKDDKIHKYRRKFFNYDI